MTYEKLAQFTQGTHKEFYYDVLITHRSIIFKAILDRPKKQIAHDMNMTAPAFSTFYQCILAIERLDNV
jgi:hypothetical protein